MTNAQAVDLAALPRAELEVMREAGARVLEATRVLANTSDNVVGELLRDSATFYEWNHYPDGDVFDPRANLRPKRRADLARDRQFATYRLFNLSRSDPRDPFGRHEQQNHDQTDGQKQDSADNSHDPAHSMPLTTVVSYRF